MNARFSPEFDFEALREQANRERAQAFHQYVIVPLIRLFSRAPRSHRRHPGTRRRATA